MSWKITIRKFKAILVIITLLLTATNSWLSMKFPFFIGYFSENPLGIYRFRLVSYEVTDYGSQGNVGVIEEFGNFYDGILIALGKDFIYRTDRYEYPLRRDVIGIIIFFSYLASLVVNTVLLVAILMIIKKQLVKSE